MPAKKFSTTATTLSDFARGEGKTGRRRDSGGRVGVCGKGKRALNRSVENLRKRARK